MVGEGQVKYFWYDHAVDNSIMSLFQYTTPKFQS